MLPTPVLLTVEELSASYGSIQALHQVNLQVEEGQIACVLGANGAGKTTLMRALSGLMEKPQGRTHFQGRDLLSMEAEDIVKYGIAHVPQGRMVFAQLSVLDNLKLGGYTRPAKEVLHDIDRVLSYFPRLKERIAQRAGTLSGGEQQMLAIARGLLSKPKLLMLDEPSMGVAPILKEFIFEKLREIRNAENLSILLVEQDAALALQIADMGYVMETGRIVLKGPCDELSRSDVVQQAYLSTQN
jgi:branched-chain amino acid transport system ATP-binding protein